MEELMREEPAILVVDDNPQVLDSYRKILTTPTDKSTAALNALEQSLFGKSAQASHSDSQQFIVEFASSGQAGCEKVKQLLHDNLRVAVAFVDMRMPGKMDGLQTIETLWLIDPNIQVVICSAYADNSWEDISARIGQTDQLLILRKPFERIEILQIASALLNKWNLLHERESQLTQLEHCIAERTQHLQKALQERERFEHQLQHKVTHDDLTDLPNRTLLLDRLNQALTKAKRYHTRLMVCFIDLDRFKYINDHFGHDVGDQLLCTIAERMTAIVRKSDTLARIGGDEFVLVISDYDRTETAMHGLQRLIGCISKPLQVAGTEVEVTCSIGCSTYPEDGDDVTSLLKFADAAMYSAKAHGCNIIQLYNASLRANIEERIRIETELRQAIKRNQLQLYYQPQVDLHRGCVTGVEALLRWQHPELGTILPNRFIPIAEDTGLIRQVTEWVLQEACKQGKTWQESGIEMLQIAVNISAKQINDVAFPSLVSRCLSATGFDPERLELEITESSAMENPDFTIPLMHLLKALGVKLSIDDFGTGYSNMYYLKSFPVDKLKLDGSFVQEVTTDKCSHAIVSAIITMGQALGLSVIAEMTETEDQVVTLAEQGCDLVQGFYFSKPLTALECEKLLWKGAVALPKALQ